MREKSLSFGGNEKAVNMREKKLSFGGKKSVTFSDENETSFIFDDIVITRSTSYKDITVASLQKKDTQRKNGVISRSKSFKDLSVEIPSQEDDAFVRLKGIISPDRHRFSQKESPKKEAQSPRKESLGLLRRKDSLSPKKNLSRRNSLPSNSDVFNYVMDNKDFTKIYLRKYSMQV